jgi:protein tyrosine/serine phosphatase
MRALIVPTVYGLALVVALTSITFGYYRMRYDHAKRLRVVTPGKLYRSGQLTAAGFEDALRRFQIRTVLNLQNEAPNPVLETGESEREVARRLGAKFVFIEVDLLNPWEAEGKNPASLEEFYALMEDPNNFPMLIHCRAGLHRTGILTAIYREEFEGWTRDQAMRELRGHGFGDTNCTSRNNYIQQYLLQRTPRQRVVQDPPTAEGLHR